MAEFIANDKPIAVSYRGEIRMPIFQAFIPNVILAVISRQRLGTAKPEVDCLIVTGGLEDCFDKPEELIAAVDDGQTLDG